MDYKLKHSIKKIIVFIVCFAASINVLGIYPKNIHGENITQIIEKEIIEEETTEEKIVKEETIGEEITNEEKPYESLIQKTNAEGYISVYTAEDLKNVKNDLAGKYSLENDIDLAKEEWIPIGNLQNPFIGIFNGNNHTISNFKIESESDNIGFFGFTNSAEIRDLVIENSTVSGKDYIGALIGRAKYSKISNTHIKESAITGNGGTGGLVGYAETTEIEKCSVTGEGLVTGNASVGGVIGFMIYASKISESFSNIDVKGNGKNIGGLVGTLGVSGDIRNCYSSSSVHGSTYYTAGILGNGNGGEATIIENTLFTGVVSSNAGIWSYYLVGGVVVKKSYFDLNTVIATIPADQAKTFDELTQKSTYVDWDFENIWEIEEGKSYPTLKNNFEITKPVEETLNFIFTIELNNEIKLVSEFTNVKWISSDNEVATVTDGLIKALSIGTTKITMIDLSTNKEDFIYIKVK